LKKFKSFFLLFDIELEALKNFEIDSLINHLWFAETKKNKNNEANSCCLSEASFRDFRINEKF